MYGSRYIEDIKLGEQFTSDWAAVDPQEALAFAKCFDPQLFHIDEQAGQRHPLFDGLSASGFYTLVITHRLLLAEQLDHAWGLVGKGIDRMRWIRPVRLGEKLRVEGRIVEIVCEASRPFGTVLTEVDTVNEAGARVLAMTVHFVVPARNG